MGVNVKCMLSAGARLGDVAMVAGALLGNKSYHQPIRGSGGIFARVDGTGTDTTSDPTMANIVLYLNEENPAARDIAKTDSIVYRLSYHFEAGEMGEPLLMPACTPAKIALCVGLCQFFGGTVDFNDCDDVDVDFTAPRPDDIHASDGKEWDHLQRRILAVQPLTQAEIDYPLRSITTEKLATLTEYENAHWETIFADYVNSGHSEKTADKNTWKELQILFPRLKAFDGCKP